MTTQETDRTGIETLPASIDQFNGHHEDQATHDFTQWQVAMYRQEASDAGNAIAIKLMFPGDIRYTDEHGWFVWNGTIWDNNEHEVRMRVLQTLKVRHGLAEMRDNNQLLFYTRSDRENVTGAMFVLQSLVHTDFAWFDRLDDRLPCLNGVVDLRTGELLPHDKDYGFTWTTPVNYNPHADTSEWEQVVSQNIAGGSEELVALQTWFGYSFTGETKEELFVYIYGPGGSGKSITVESVQGLLPEPVSQTRSFSTFTARRKDDTQNFDLAGLSRARFVHAHESERHVEINASLLKQLIGTGYIHAAYKGKDGFDFRNKIKVTVTSNFEFNADVDDSAAWNRPMIISFPHERRETDHEDKTLKAHFQEPAQQEAILKWVVDGAVNWYANGLVIPKSFREDKRLQRERLDMVGLWLEENTAKVDGQKLCSEEAMENYQQWCKLNAVTPKQGKSFSQAMKNKGQEPDKGRNCRYWRDLFLTRTYSYNPVDRRTSMVVHEPPKPVEPDTDDSYPDWMDD